MSSESAQSLESQLRKLHGWTSAAFLVWARAKCECEYCGEGVLTNRQSLRGATYDHILPKARYTALFTEEETRLDHGRTWLEFTGHQYSNLALCCWTCNTMKNTWDPNAADPLVAPDVEDLTDDQRAEFLRRVREHIRPRWEKYDQELERARSWIERITSG